MTDVRWSENSHLVNLFSAAVSIFGVRISIPRDTKISEYGYGFPTPLMAAWIVICCFYKKAEVLSIHTIAIIRQGVLLVYILFAGQKGN